ncbi:hypothetical protein C7H19_14570 [Aphanothece hegewaldii CCALA 016]|uniref:Uncharacterized protein n=1 Tax=Aphanothece hegewaldii CCALA 016 TaxID=2107694 RepID=A0A2T1LVT0_9CHRO|nr:hypothetical protein [Aphanothece hegewaldii]PSF35969.1 hypothetical protein C7H19_14570 [Aphanothece hegewaldii CCALA 016]
MFNFNTNLGSICQRALENQLISRKVEKNFREITAKRRHCCRNCAYFDDNPYLPCAIEPIQAALPDEVNTCRFFERSSI